MPGTNHVPILETGSIARALPPALLLVADAVPILTLVAVAVAVDDDENSAAGDVVSR